MASRRVELLCRLIYAHAAQVPGVDAEAALVGARRHFSYLDTHLQEQMQTLLDRWQDDPQLRDQAARSCAAAAVIPQQHQTPQLSSTLRHKLDRFVVKLEENCWDALVSQGKTPAIQDQTAEELILSILRHQRRAGIVTEGVHHPRDLIKAARRARDAGLSVRMAWSAPGWTDPYGLPISPTRSMIIAQTHEDAADVITAMHTPHGTKRYALYGLALGYSHADIAAFLERNSLTRDSRQEMTRELRKLAGPSLVALNKMWEAPAFRSPDGPSR